MLLGWEAEVYSTDVKEGYKLAEKAMDNQINNVCLSLIGGDIQKMCMFLRINQSKHLSTLFYRFGFVPIF